MIERGWSEKTIAWPKSRIVRGTTKHTDISNSPAQHSGRGKVLKEGRTASHCSRKCPPVHHVKVRSRYSLSFPSHPLPSFACEPESTKCAGARVFGNGLNAHNFPPCPPNCDMKLCSKKSFCFCTIVSSLRHLICNPIDLSVAALCLIGITPSSPPSIIRIPPIAPTLV